MGIFVFIVAFVSYVVLNAIEDEKEFEQKMDLLDELERIDP